MPLTAKVGKEPVFVKLRLENGEELLFGLDTGSPHFHSDLLKIVHHDLLAGLLEDTVNELQVQRVSLVIVLYFLIGEDDVEGDLVRLIDDRAMA